jgi:hypothetical protein
MRARDEDLPGAARIVGRLDTPAGGDLWAIVTP